MKLNNLTFVKLGHYSIGDIKDYLYQLSKKYDEELENQRLLNAKKLVDDHIKDSINGYKHLLLVIGEKENPNLARAIRETIERLENLNNIPPNEY